MALQVCLLGTPRLVLAGAAPELLRSERPAQLIAYLACRRGWVARDELTELLWPDEVPSTARQNLRWALHKARSVAGASLQTDRQRVGLLADSDLGAFDAACDAGRHAEATAHYAGPLLAGMEDGASVPFQQWLAAARERARVRFVDAALRAGQSALAHDAAGALDLAERVLAEDATEARAVELQICALGALGRAAEAKHRYAAYSAQLWSEQQLEPSASLQRAVQTLERSVAPAPARRRAVDEFVGRDEELAQLATLLAQPDCRLITVIGVGGVGKSRLIAEWARRDASARTRIVSLESLTLPMQLAGTVASALPINPVAGETVEQRVVRALAAAQRTLLLDNFESVIDAAPQLSAWLDACPALKIVVTSRERLELPGEWLLPLGGLGGPKTTGDAARLFVARAQASDAGFDAQAHAADVARIVQLVDGMPLALELAAGAVRLLPCRDIADDLAQALDLLSSSRGFAGGGVDASIERSWSLLTPRERDAFVRLAVFEAPFDVATARAVCEVGAAALALLRDKSMLQAHGEDRLHMHPLLRRFAADRLGEQPALESQVRDRHARHFAAMLEGTYAAQPLRVDARWPELLAAWRRGVSTRQADIVSALASPLARSCFSSGRSSEALGYLDAAADSLGGALPRAAAAIDAARASLWLGMGEAEAAEVLARSALASARVAHDRAIQLRSLLTLGEALRNRGRLGEAQPYLLQAQRQASARGDAQMSANSLRLLALIDKQQGRFGEALTKLEQAEPLYRSTGDWQGLASLLNNRGNLHLVLDQTSAARAAFETGLLISVQRQLDASLPFLHVNLARLAFQRDDFDAAHDHAARALEHARAQRVLHIELAALCVLAGVHTMRGAVAQARQCLAEAARVPAPFPALFGVAITYARVLACTGELARSFAAATMVVADVRATEPDRHEAGIELRRVEGRLSAPERAEAQALAARLTLEGVIAEVAATA